jgi:ferredoxin
MLLDQLFVDESCIDCDVCRWLCPSVFARKGLMSIVSEQPTDQPHDHGQDNERAKLQAYSAMVACPVGAIRLHQPDPLVKKALDAFPAQVVHTSPPCLCLS